MGAANFRCIFAPAKADRIPLRPQQMTRKGGDCPSFRGMICFGVLQPEIGFWTGSVTLIGQKSGIREGLGGGLADFWEFHLQAEFKMCQGLNSVDLGSFSGQKGPRTGKDCISGCNVYPKVGF
jgi:hypothetical protein